MTSGGGCNRGGPALAIAAEHSADPVLRYDHSGWSLVAGVTPFSDSLVIYPLLGLVAIGRRWPRVRAADAD